MSIWVSAGLVFAAAFVLDGLWILYMAAARNKKALACALWSALMFAFAGFNVISYMTNHWLLVAAALGAASGTFTFMKLHKE